MKITCEPETPEERQQLKDKGAAETGIIFLGVTDYMLVGLRPVGEGFVPIREALLRGPAVELLCSLANLTAMGMLNQYHMQIAMQQQQRMPNIVRPGMNGPALRLHP